MQKLHHKNLEQLCQVFLVLETEIEVYNFLKDLCTPSELEAFSERWNICQYLHQGLSYRKIHEKIGASLTTIGKVARFLKDEPYQGYRTVLKKLNKISGD